MYPYSDQMVEVKRDGSLIMPHSLPGGTGMGQRGLDRHCSFPQSTRGTNFVSHQKKQVWTFSKNIAEPTSGGNYDGPCITGAPVDELVQAVVTTPQRGDLARKPMFVGCPKKDSWRNDAEFRIWQPPKFGGFELILVDFHLVFSCVFAAEMCFLRSHGSLFRRQYSIRAQSPSHSARS